MSCSKCGSVNTSCGCKDTAYTTPKVYTCPPDTSCPQPVRCSEFMDAACIFLNDGIADAGIQPGSSLESIVQQLILLVTNPGCVDAPGGVPGGGTVTFIDAIWPGNAITIAGGPIANSGTFVFNGNGTSNQYIDGQGNLQTFPSIPQAIALQTNGTPNSTQVLLNLVAGTGITLTESGGSVTIDVDAVEYSVQNGLSEQPADSGVFELGAPTVAGAPLLHDTYIEAAGYGFDIHAASLIYYQGNRIEVESGAAGALVWSTGGPSDNSIEVDGAEVAIESVSGATTTKIFLDPTRIRIQTPLYNSKNDGDVLTLIDKTTGEVEYMPVVGILLQTDGTDNADQELLNLVSGNGITLTNTGGDVVIDGPLFQTDGTDNSVQTLLNLVAGTGITLTESAGSVTIEAAAPAINLTTNDFGGASTYDPLTGDLNIPIYQTQLDIQDEGNTEVINPTFLNFIGDGVTATISGTGADITFTGSEYNGDQGVYKDTDPLLPNETFMLGAPSGSQGTIPFMEDRFIDVDDFRLQMEGTSNVLRLITGGGVPVDTDAPLVVASDTTFYAGTFTGVNNPAVLAYTTGTDTYALEVTNAGTGSLSYAARFQSDPGHGLQVESLSNSTFYLNAAGSSNNSIDNVLYIWKNTTGVASVGEGTSIIMSPGTDGAGSLIPDGVVLNSILASSTDVEFRIDTTNAGTLQPSTSFKGDGEIRFHEYGVGTFANPAVYILGVDASGNVVETTAGGLGIEVDGTPLSSSSLLNFVPSTDIGITDLGGGFVQFTLVNPLITYDSNEGVFNDSNVFKLGSPSYAEAASVSEKFLENRFIYTDTNTLQILGLKNEEAPSYIVNIVNEFTGQGGSALQLDHYGAGSGLVILQDKAASANSGMFGISIFASNNPSDPGNTGYTTGIGIDDTVGNDEYRGLRIYSASTNTLPIYITRTEAGATVANTIERFMLLERLGIPANGRGGSIDFSIVTSTNASQDSNKLISKWFDSTNASRKSQFEIQGSNSGTVQTQFTILGGGTSGPAGAWSLTPGQIKFDRYAAGAIYKSADDLEAASGFNLGIDANGNIWATDFSVNTEPIVGVNSVSIGTLSNGASASVTDPGGPDVLINVTGQNAYTQIGSDSGTASADTFNSQFSVVGADGITTSLTNNPMPGSDVITVTGPDKFLTFVTKDIGAATIATYTPTVWNDTLNIQAGTGIVIENGGSANTIVIRSTGGGISSVVGTDANGFTVDVANGTSAPDITVGTNVTGVLVGNGTAVSAVTGTGVMVFTGTSYTFQALPTVNNGALNVAMGTNAASGIAVQWGTATGFTANIATNIQYDLRVGPALVNFATYMSQTLPADPTPGAGVLATRPVYIRKSAIDNYTDATPVTTFSPGTTGFTVTSGFSSATALGINENVVLGGVLNVSSGGTGLSTAPGNGQILIGNGTGYTLANISQGPGIIVTNSAGGIQISATGIPGPGALNGLHIHSDGSIRLGSGTPADGDTIRPLIERTDIRMNGQIYRLSTDNTGIITNIGFQINDGTTARNGFFGSSSGGTVDTANTPEVAYIFSGAGGTALTSYNGFYIDRTVLAETKVYSGFSSSVRQVIARSATLANNKLTQVGTWGSTINSTFYEAIPSARTIQIGSIEGNNNWIKLDDNLQRVDFNKSTIYASGYGGGLVTSGTGLTYLIGTDAGGKFFEFAGRSISRISGNTGSPFSAASMASAAAPVTFSIVGTGSISTDVVGNVLTISNSASTFPYWSNITLGVRPGTSGTSTGGPVIPNIAGANTLNIVAGNNIGLIGEDGNDRITISAVIPNLWNTIAVVNGSAAGGASSLTPNIALDTLTFAGGTGISVSTNPVGFPDRVVITNSGVTQIVAGTGISITATGGSGTGSVTINSAAALPSTNGVWQHPDALTPTEYRLGSDTDGPSTFTQDRWINAQSSFLQIKGTPATGDANGILKLLSTGAGRGLRVENSNASPNGAIYATSAQLTSTDAAPTGTIYGNSSGVGSAIVGDGSDTAGASTRPAIFGKGYIGVKGSSTTAQAAGLVAGGVGVYGTAVVASGSSYGVIGSPISATDILLPNTANTKTGVYGEAPGGVREGGFAQDITSYGGRFVINATGNTGAPQTGNLADINIARGLRSLVNVGDVVQLIRYSSTSPVSGIGGALVFNVETNTDNGLGDGQKAGRVGYKISRVISPIDSRFFVTTSTSNSLDGTQIELERFAIRNTGQAELSSYAALDPAVSNVQGQFIPTASTLTGYTNYYDYSALGVKTNSATNNEERGRIDTLRTRHGKYFPASITADGTTGYDASNMSVVINDAYFSSLNNIVTVHVAGSMSFSSGGASSARNFSMPLPIAASAPLLTGDVIVSITFNNYATYSYLGLVSNQGIAGATQRYRINVDTTASLPLSGSLPFSAIFTYKLI